MFIQYVCMYVYVWILGRRGDSVPWMTKLVPKNKCISPLPYRKLRSMATSDGWKWIRVLIYITFLNHNTRESSCTQKRCSDFLTTHRAACHPHLLESHQGPQILLFLQVAMWGQLGDWMEGRSQGGSHPERTLGPSWDGAKGSWHLPAQCCAVTNTLGSVFSCWNLVGMTCGYRQQEKL